MTRRSLQGIADQSVYAITNLLLVLTVARQVSVAEFGRFSAVYLVVACILSVSRGWWGQPLLYLNVQTTGVPPVSRSLPFTVPAGLLLAAGSVLLLSAEEGAIAAIAIPIVGLQDVLRYRCFAAQRPHISLVCDAVWLGVQGACLVGIELSGVRGGTGPALAWAFGAVVSLLVAITATGPIASGGSGERSESQRGASRAFVLDSCVQLGRNQLLIGAFAIFVGWQGAGAMRLVVSLFGFVPMVVTGLMATALPQMMNPEGGHSVDVGAIIGHLRRVSMTMSATGIAILLAVAATPAPSNFFGAETWALASPLLAGIAVAYMAHAFEAPLHVVVYGSAGPWTAVRTKIMASLVQVGCTVVGLAVVRSGPGGTYAMAVGSIAGLAVWWHRWSRTKDSSTGGLGDITQLSAVTEFPR